MKNPVWHRLHKLVASLIATVLVAFFALWLAVRLMPLPTPPSREASVIYDAAGREVTRLFTENRVDIPLSEIPLYLQEAVVATEDTRFWEHHGLDPVGIARALWRDLLARRIVEGGSTITQQLARGLYLTQKRTWRRKLLEVPFTLKLEMTYTKSQILAMYLNQIYLGEGAYGVEVAAETYFGKHAYELNLAECALIAGLARSPEVYSPFNDINLAKQRRSVVLERMADAGYITPSEKASADAAPIVLAPRPPRQYAFGYFVDYVLAQIRSALPDVAKNIYVGGYRIYTTLDVQMQQEADGAVKAVLGTGTPDARGVLQPEAALVAIDPATGYIKAMVGGLDYKSTQLNRAVATRRQPGSAFKPFLYTAVIDAGIPPTAMQECEPVSFPGPTPDSPPYQPEDYGNKPPGQNFHWQPFMIRRAIAESDNITAVKWMAAIGPDTVIRYAQLMGIESPLARDIPLALGDSAVTPLEMARAYATLANLGRRVTPIALLRVEDSTGEVLLQNNPVPPVPVLDPRVAYIMVDLMKSVLDYGTGSAHNLGRPAAAKTGSTNNLTDAWFVGFTPDLVTAVWVGNDNPAIPVGHTGTGIAGPIWEAFMRSALASLPPRDWDMPSGVVRLTVSSVDGLLPNPNSPVMTEVFLTGTEPTAVSPILVWPWAATAGTGPLPPAEAAGAPPLPPVGPPIPMPQPLAPSSRH